MSGLYIHIPYCHSKCAYCDFYSRPDDGRMSELASAIIKEYNCRRNEINEPVNTIYIGGGTPSILPDNILSNIIEGVVDGISPIEFTIEANPEDISVSKLQFWRKLGINRVSMGVQSLCDGELKAIGRRHDSAAALSAIELIFNAGFDKISCDLIYGLPGQTIESWTRSLCELLDTGISHLSAYSLTYEPGTRLYAAMLSGKVKPADDNLVADLYGILTSTTKSYGFRHYEISNFAIPGDEALHNSAYWNLTPYLGLGPSAHSFDGVKRKINPASVSVYIKSVPCCETEYETEIDRINDFIITSLRTDSGLSLDLLPVWAIKEIERNAREWVERSMLIKKGNSLIIPEDSWLMADAIMRDLIIEQ